MNDQARVAALSLDAVERRYGRGDTTVEVLNGASLELLRANRWRLSHRPVRQVDALHLAALSGPTPAK